MEGDYKIAASVAPGQSAMQSRWSKKPDERVSRQTGVAGRSFHKLRDLRRFHRKVSRDPGLFKALQRGAHAWPRLYAARHEVGAAHGKLQLRRIAQMSKRFAPCLVTGAASAFSVGENKRIKRGLSSMTIKRFARLFFIGRRIKAMPRDKRTRGAHQPRLMRVRQAQTLAQTARIFLHLRGKRG